MTGCNSNPDEPRMRLFDFIEIVGSNHAPSGEAYVMPRDFVRPLIEAVERGESIDICVPLRIAARKYRKDWGRAIARLVIEPKSPLR